MVRPWILWVLAWSLVGCPPAPKGAPVESEAPPCTELAWYLDADKDGYGDGDYALSACAPPDGYAARAGDCDDGDGDISPGADERCDDLDNDCDGDVDESGTLSSNRYWDRDGDGYGGDPWTEAGCSAPDGTVSNDDDCDDADAAISPEAAEVCDEVDNDCDGEIDGRLAIDAQNLYRDYDGDGIGWAPRGQGCRALGSVYDTGDCDDTDAAIFPEAPEVCDGSDNNCDGNIDEFAVDALTWYRDADGDGAGDAAWSRPDCDMPTGFVSTDDDCDDSAADINPSAAEICGDGLDNNCDGEIDLCALFAAP